MAVAMPPPSLPGASGTGAPLGPAPAAPLTLQEIKPVRIDPHTHGIETENVSTGSVLRSILAARAGGIQAEDGSPFTLEDIESVQYDIDESEGEIRDGEGMPVYYERDEVEEKPDGTRVEHKQGQKKTQKGFSYQTFDHDGVPCIALPIVCRAIVNRGGRKQTVEFIQTYYTRLEAPSDKHLSPFEQENFKNKLMITLITIRKNLTLDKLKTDADNPGPTRIAGKLEADTSYISTGRGFTDEKRNRWFGHEQVRQRYNRFESEEFLGVELLGYGTLDAIQSKEYKKDVLPDSPQRMPENFATLPVVYRGPVSPSRDPNIAAAHDKLDDLRRECAAYQAAHLASPTQPNPRKEAVQRLLSDWRHSPPPDSAPAFILQHATEHALATMEHLTDIMQNTFSTSTVDPSTGRTEVTLIRDDIHQYQLLAVEVSVREKLTPLKVRQKTLQDALMKAKKNLAQNEDEAKQAKKELAALTSKQEVVRMLSEELQAKQLAGAPPAEIAKLQQDKQDAEQAFASVKPQIDALEAKIQQLISAKPALDTALQQAENAKKAFEDARNPPTDPSNKEKMEELERQLNPDYRSHPLTQKNLDALIATGRQQFTRLSDRQKVMEQLHETLQQDLDTRRTIEDLCPETQEDREVKADLLDALKKSEFGGMKGAIEAFKGMIERLTPMPDPRPRPGMALISV